MPAPYLLCKFPGLSQTKVISVIFTKLCNASLLRVKRLGKRRGKQRGCDLEKVGDGVASDFDARDGRHALTENVGWNEGGAGGRGACSSGNKHLQQLTKCNCAARRRVRIAKETCTARQIQATNCHNATLATSCH